MLSNKQTRYLNYIWEERYIVYIRLYFEIWLTRVIITLEWHEFLSKIYTFSAFSVHGNCCNLILNLYFYYCILLHFWWKTNSKWHKTNQTFTRINSTFSLGWVWFYFFKWKVTVKTLIILQKNSISNVEINLLKFIIHKIIPKKVYHGF